jgi:hypothetical protein
VTPAVRSATSGWRDPRLWVGVALVAVSVVAGARFLAAADDTVQVWAVAADLAPGEAVAEGDLVAERVRFADEDRLAGYFTVDDELPAGSVLLRAVGDGELLPRAAVGTAEDDGMLELPISVDPALVPPSVGAGSVVSVYAAAPAGAGRPVSTGATDSPLLEGARVVDAPADEPGFSATGRRQLVLAVTEADVERYFEVTAAAEDPVLTVVAGG